VLRIQLLNLNQETAMTIQSSKKIALIINLSILGVASAMSLQANASDAIGPGDNDAKWVLGIEAGVFNNPYSGEGTESYISPTVRYNGERFFIKDGSVNLHLAETHGFSGGLTATIDAGFLSDYDNYNRNDQLSGISERDATVLGGVYINHDTDLGRLSFRALTDLGDKHDGHVANLKYTFDLKAGDWNINPMVGVEWVSDEIVNHHVGVFNYSSGKSTTNTFAGVRARYDVTENWDVNLKTGVTKLGSGISNSLIIDDDLVYQASVGINYNF
jgi:outer membrane protein